MRTALMLAWGYKMLVGQHIPGAVGGAEVQMTRLARHLARRQEDVWFLCGDPGDAKEQTVNGIHLLPAFRLRGGLPILRFFQMKRDIERAMAHADADVYVQRCASPITGIAADWARRHGRKFVYMVANDPNVDGGYESAVGVRDRWLYRRGLKHASGIVAQTAWQREQLRKRFGREALLLPSALEIPDEAAPPARPEIVFWAASFQPHKRPHLVFEIARRAPDLHFVLAGSVAGDVDYGNRLLTEAAKLPNVECVGEVPYDRMPDYYGRSIALLSTSQHEGFSNTFLEAWRCGAPVVSLSVDPDGLIRRDGLGAVTEDFEEVVAELRALSTDTARRARIAAGARRAIERHSAPRVTGVLARYLAALVDGADERTAAQRAQEAPAAPTPASETPASETPASGAPAPAASAQRGQVLDPRPAGH